MRIGKSLVNAYQNAEDGAAREDMSWGSLLGGLALANAGLGAVHGFAGPIGGMFKAPHGAVCAAILPHATRINIKALKSRNPNHPALIRYREAGFYLLGQEMHTEENLVEWLEDLIAKLHIRPLRDWGITESQVELIVEKAAQASSMKGNPVQLEAGELKQILMDAL